MTYEKTELTPKDFYRHLRTRDRPTVERVVESLHEHGFDVYATGSSLERRNYSSIDLVVLPRELAKMKRARRLRALNDAIEASWQECLKKDRKLSRPGSYLNIKLGYHLSPNKKRGTHTFSGVEEQRQLDYSGTKIDLALMVIPFVGDVGVKKVDL